MILGYLFTVLSVALWGASFIGTKIAYQAFSPLFLCLVRFGLAFLLMHIVRMIRHDHEKPDRESMKKIIISAIIGVSLYYALENLAVDMTSASNASLIAGSYPAIVALTGVLFFKEHYGLRRLLGIALAVAGVFILTQRVEMEGGGNPLLGNLILVFDGFLWGFYNYLIPDIDNSLQASTITYYQTMYGVLFLLPFSFIGTPVTGPITWSVVLAVLFLAVLCSVFAYTMYTAGLRVISAAAAASIMNLMPIVGVVLSALILHENITARHLIGGAVILLGVFISSAVNERA